MARGIQRAPSTNVAAPELPKISFQKINDDLTSPTTGVDDRQARSYGYNDFSDFQRPEHYIRHIEPLEADLARQVEYDMDEQDKEWLDNLNAERRKEQVDKISYETFEIIMDRLEKEWFDLTKNIPKPDFAMPSEDSTCAICDDSEGENSNAIVFCDGCNLAVHQDCYGVPYIPEGQWLCRKCTVSPENPVGAFKQTVNGEWVHLLCAIWVPETRVANDVFMEPVIGVEKISKQRWKLKCSICDIREGACIQCAKTSCFLAFHPTCARKEKLLLPMKSTQAESATLTCYCDKHLPKEQQEAREAALAAEEEAEEDDDAHPSKLSKSARAYAKTYKPGPPLVPAIIVDRITQYISKVTVRKRSDFLLMVCKYWSLKREARRGAPLLKRLHLEPWTAAGSAKLQSEEERAMKLEQLRRLEQGLENLRELSALTWKRESRKMQQMDIIQNILIQTLYPHESRLRFAFERIVGYDKNNYFKNPVNKAEVPDYFDVVKRPMCWSIIDTKLDRHEYWDIQDFRDDIKLVLDNATSYNKAGSPFHKAAQRIRNSAEPILQDLESLSTRPALPTSLNGEQEMNKTSVKVENSALSPSLLLSASKVGNLEPPLELVELLLSLDAIRDESELILSADPLTSLLNIEFPVLKPPPPPPTPKPRKAPKLKLPKRDRSEERKRYKAKKAEERAHRAEMEAVMVAAGIPTQRIVIRTRRFSATAATTAESADTSPMPEMLGTTRAAPPEFSYPSIPSSPSRSRIPMDMPSVPEFRDDVDQQASFKLFNSGWILPSDQKRRTRVLAAPSPAPALERMSLPPPKKKLKLDRGVSKLSVFSTAEEENETLKHGEPSGSGSVERSSAPRSTRSESTSLRALSQAAVAAVTADQMDVDSPLHWGTHKEQQRSNDTHPELLSDDAVAVDTSVNNPFIEPSGLPRIGSIIRGTDGKIIIEELDSPATRRQKHLRRKAEREKGRNPEGEPTDTSTMPSMELSTAVAEPQSPELESAHVPSRLEASPSRKDKAKAKVEIEPDLIWPSDEDEATKVTPPPSPIERSEPLVPAVRTSKRVRRRSAASIASASSSSAKASSSKVAPEQPKKQPKQATSEFRHDQILEQGTLVWAKAETFPWWPAVIFETNDATIPQAARTMYAKKSKNTKNTPLYFVRFYDKQLSWQCLTIDKLLPLGEDDELDADLVANHSKRQKWKNPRIRTECREAWRYVVD
ncbi:hypothetical protein BDP27DRAFT_1381784 [Rhodocollybia butyracea]|uniref:Uncharacterized protein n=1 Tax=Rhodocollybia butyracea TaxID=206335 RepID=A0A9P5Q1V7_9AGAR|nr:hypothetical protein BDP27DRAFT_1381784 [Rhodocollybia butyracea]